MDRLLISKNQEDALNIWKRFECGFSSFVKKTRDMSYNFSPLEDFTPEQFALLLCGWYEVKEEYKVGDWVVHIVDNYIARITKISEGWSKRGGIFVDHKDVHGWLYNNEVRKATTKEVELEKKRRFWSRLGRKVDEYRTGDVVTRKIESGLFEITEISKHYPSCVKITKNMCETEELVPLHEISHLVVPVGQRLDLQ